MADGCSPTLVRLSGFVLIAESHISIHAFPEFPKTMNGASRLVRAERRRVTRPALRHA